jgi:hypothetical protein
VSLLDRFTFAVLRLLPLPETAPRNRTIWRVWLRLVESRYQRAEDAWGRERAKVYDYIPF